ncbi:MAG TPA: hypothetical protein VIL86_14685 [Tepidisphaeraceae bacterium]
MPPINQQQSRAGLVTTVVILAILVVGTTIGLFYLSAELKKSEQDYTAFKKKYEVIATQASLTSPEVQSLIASAKKIGPTAKALDASMTQTRELARQINGSEDATTAQDAAKAALDAANKIKLPEGVKTPATLVDAVNVLSNAYAGRSALIDHLEQQVKEIESKNQGQTASVLEQLKKKDEDLTTARAEAQKQVEGANAVRTDVRKQMADAEEAIKKERATALEAINKKDQEIATVKQQADKLKKERDLIAAKLDKQRLPVGEPMVRAVDGHIVRLAGNGIVFIDRGQGQQIVAGLTFEVYDKNEGVPPLGEGTSNDNLPVGKASIEVIHVGANSSECRIVKQQKGTAISEGDLIVNLIYDPNTKYNFVVYGAFDLDQNGIPDPRDADVIKRLVTQWGGKMQEDVTPSTDFLVVGDEPKVFEVTKKELEDDPILKAKHDKAEADLAAYQAMVQKARDLHVPVLNQNRFLYFIGYYDQAKR